MLRRFLGHAQVCSQQRLEKLSRSFSGCGLSCSGTNRTISNTAERTTTRRVWGVNSSLRSRITSRISRGFAAEENPLVCPRERIRNIAIIAHVDHGKTTLVDCILKEAGAGFENERVMDKNELEKEKGITILAKVTGLSYKDHYINIVDTPGHADFGGEVERIMNMVDGVCLVVCACEGPMAQTKYVLKKAIQSGVKPIVIINKVDREGQRVKEVESELFDLFIELDEDEKFINYPVFHASAKAGWAVKAGDKFNPHAGVGAILDGIIEHINPPKVDTSTEKFSLLVSQIDHHPYFGRILRGKIVSGEVKVGDFVDSVNQDGQLVEQFKVTKIYKPHYMENVEVPEAKTGDIIGITGMVSSRIGDTLSTKGIGRVIPAVKIDPPMIMVEVTASNSPLAGQAGAISSFNDIVGVLKREADSDIALSCRFEPTSVFVSGRGDLHLGVLFERLRRNGYEMEVSAPMIITKKENGKILDPLEQVSLEVDEKYVPQLMERILNRAGTVTEVMTDSNNPTKQIIVAEVFSKGLIGFRVEVANATNNTALYKSQFLRYDLCTTEPERQPKGAIVSTADGKTSLYGLRDVEKLGNLFVKGGQQVYEGMIIGESGKELDWDVNPTKLKELTNIRTHEKDEKVRLVPPREFSIEEAICYIREDELVDIGPNGIRMRKKIRSKDARRIVKRNAKKSKE